MGKSSRKRQKTAGVPEEDAQPLGVNTLLDADSTKDDEERRLESLLFGTPYIPSGAGAGKNVFLISDDEDEGEEAGAALAEMQNLEDTDLFYIDDGIPETSIPDELVGDIEEDSEDSGSESDGDGSQSEAEPEPTPVARKGAAWADEDDTTLQVSLSTDNRLRKLRDAPSEDVVGGREYERRLRRQYEKINPTPDWAAQARKKVSTTKRRRPSTSSTEDAEDFVSELLRSTGGILDVQRKGSAIAPGTLSIERLRDANQAAKSEGSVNVVQFHPSPQAPILLTASADRRLRLFNIDGHTNPHLQTVHIPGLPLTNAQYHPSGSSILITGPRPFYYTYDLQSGTTHRSPRGLWGTTFNGTQTAEGSMEKCAFDATGSVLAVAGRRGYVHLVDWKSGAGQVVGSLKQNAGIRDLWWQGSELMSLGENAEVNVWDVGARKCLRKWKDDGGFGSNIMQGDKKTGYLAVGSTSGLVNVYGSDTSAVRPKPLKTIGNLTTSISTLRFNHDSQLLAIASNSSKDQLRMIHLPSMTAFGNWPTSSTPLGKVNCIDFSAGSEHVAIGNSRGRVLLYSLRDFR